MKHLHNQFWVTILLCLAAQVQGQIIDVNFSGGGATSYSAWTNLGVSYGGYGGNFPGPSNWPAPIPANAGSTTASINRTSGGAPGSGPYITRNPITDTNGAPISTGSIYFGSFSGATNVLGGTVRLAESSALSGVQSIVFQIQIGEVFGYDFFEPSGFPALTLDGDSSAIPVSFTNLVNSFENGIDPQFGTPVFINTWGYQWNLTNGQIPASYAITMSGVAHSQIYALRLDSTTVLQQQAVVPEPSVVSLLLAGGLLLGLYLSKKRRLLNNNK